MPEFPPGVRVGVAVPAAGHGRRMGGARKPFLELAGEPLLAHALRPFLADDRVVAVAVAVSADDVSSARSWVEALDPRIAVVAGGATRSDSVAAAVGRLPVDLRVIVGDAGGRPLGAAGGVERCVAAGAGGAGAVAGWGAAETVLEVGGDGGMVRTPDRSKVWHAQTPQGFPADVLRSALADPEARALATDDAALVEAVGLPVVMVEGAPDNLKVTRPEDLPVAEILLARRRGGP